MPDTQPHAARDPVRNVSTALSSITGHWQPHRMATVNDHAVKAVKLLGDFVWHSHPEDDELFYVLRGELEIEIKDAESVWLKAGDMWTVPKGVEHRPRAKEECEVLLFEPERVVNTGDAGGERTSQVKEL